MIRWPIRGDLNQISISTVTAGLGFGLVIAPIGTTTINAVRARQAGMSSAIVTSLRMVGMMLGLAALTSWALAYFKQLVSTYPSLPLTATAAQFAHWSKGYAAHIVQSAHTVYSAVFLTSMILCLIAIIPAVFLWGRKAAVAEQEVQEVQEVPEVQEVQEVPETGTGAAVVVETVPPASPAPHEADTIAGAAPLIAGSQTTPVAATATPIAGPRMIQLALDQAALTSMFVSQLGLQTGALTDMKAIPMPNDGVIISLNLHINASGIQRVMPVEMDSTVGIDKHQNIQLHVLRLKRDGIDAGTGAAASMEKALNELMISSVMPALHGHFKGVKLISVHTSTSIGCARATEMFVLLIQAPPIEGIAAQPTPVPFCFKGPVDLKKLLPH